MYPKATGNCPPWPEKTRRRQWMSCRPIDFPSPARCRTAGFQSGSCRHPALPNPGNRSANSGFLQLGENRPYFRAKPCNHSFWRNTKLEHGIVGARLPVDLALPGNPPLGLTPSRLLKKSRSRIFSTRFRETAFPTGYTPPTLPHAFHASNDMRLKPYETYLHGRRKP